MSKKCPVCGSERLRQTRDGCVGDEVLYRCRDCDNVMEEDELEDVIFFDRITASPEVLAEYLVFRDFKTGMWTSLMGVESFAEYKEAIAATVAKLKEVCK